MPNNSLLIISLALWFSSLAFPAIVSPNAENSSLGIGILLWGWLGVVGAEDGLGFLAMLAWWANPLYLLAIIRAMSEKALPIKTVYAALLLAFLGFLLGSYATNAVPSFTPVLGYGIGVLLWFLALLILAYAVSTKADLDMLPSLLLGLMVFLVIIFFAQVVWRAFASNESEKERLPYLVAKRGLICSTTAKPLLIPEQQFAIRLESKEKKWIESLINWGVVAVQVDGVEYIKAPEGSPEAEKSPFMVSRPIKIEARYSLKAEEGYPLVNKWSDGGKSVRLTLIDNKKNNVMGTITFKKEANSRLGFCPSLNHYGASTKEEAIRWLSVFINQEG